MRVLHLAARALVALAVLAFGCGDEEPAAPGIPTMTAQPGSLPAADLLDVARADLARRLGVDVNDIGVVESCALTWPDGSIGVAEPGRVYTQALVPGWLAILEHDSQEYRYHGAGEEFTAADFVADAEVLQVRC
jgi:hypothetical protein